MKCFDKKMRRMADEEKIKMPDQVKNKMEETLSKLPKLDTNLGLFRWIPRTATIAACMIFALLFVFPNVSVVYAESLEKIPVIGELIRVVTIRNYFYSDQNHEMDINVPSISDIPDSDAAKRINADVDELTGELMTQFYRDMEGMGKKGHGSIYVDYEVARNTDRWFTLKLSVSVVAGSGNNYYKYYNVDRKTGEIVTLGDLFTTSEYQDVITSDIMRQMEQQMQENENISYFTKNSDFGHDFAEVTDGHNFYFNDEGDLVIPFDKYEVAPGSMGCPEFVIQRDVIQDILKDEYQDITQ